MDREVLGSAKKEKKVRMPNCMELLDELQRRALHESEIREKLLKTKKR